MKKIYLLLVLSLILITTQAQWDTITSFNQVVTGLKEYDSKLFIGGSFTKNEESNCYWSASYNGNSISRHTTLIGGSGIKKMDVFDNVLYAVGSIQHYMSLGVSKWDGYTWENGGSSNHSHSTIYADGNDLYVEDDAGLIRKKTVGGIFETFYDFDGNGGISSIIRYNDKLIFAGSFVSIDGTVMNSIAQWDGSSWQSLGTGITGGVFCMAVYDNDLYVAGSFDYAGGLAVSDISRWDGTAWYDVGNGVTGSSYNGIWEMEVFNNELYLVGDINEIGYVASHDIIKWNGSEWKAVGLDHNEAFISCIEVYNNELYVGSYDFEKSHLYRYTGSSDINDLAKGAKLNIFPNPVKTELNISFDLQGSNTIEIEIHDMLGKVVLTKIIKTINELNTTINCHQLPKGSYMILFIDENSRSIVQREKIIVL